MAAEWREATIGDIADVFGGSTPSTRDSRNFDGDIPWLTPRDLSGEHPRYISRGERNLTSEGLRSCSARLLPINTVLLSSRAPIGYVAIAGNPIATNQGFRSLVVKADIHHEFLYYWLKANVDELERHSTGSTFKELSGSALKGIRLRLPACRAEQERIAQILGALDDKIELNRKMAATLEEMARAIFKSWFIDFDPVRAKAEGRPTNLPPYIDALFPDSFEDSELGPIPARWSGISLSGIASLAKAQISPSATPDRAFAHYSIPAYDKGRLPAEELGARILSQKFMVPADSVLVSKLNPESPRVWLPFKNEELPAICSTEFLVLEPTASSSSFLYCLALSEPFRRELNSGVTGTSKSHQRAQPLAVMAMQTVAPPPGIAHAFTELVRPLLLRMQFAMLEAVTLANARDALLPRLISGELNIAGHFPEVTHGTN